MSNETRSVVMCSNCLNGTRALNTRSPTVARIADRTSCQWPWRSSKVDDFHLIWKSVRHFLLVTNNNIGPTFHRFPGMATYSFKHSIKNCGQTAADGNMVTSDRLQKVASALSDHRRVFTTYRLATISVTNKQTDRRTANRSLLKYDRPIKMKNLYTTSVKRRRLI